MAYHIHPLTGQPAPCRAKKRCPFGDLTTEHYATREEAQAAYEASWEAVPRVATLRGPEHLQEVVEAAAQEVATLEDPQVRALAHALLRELARWESCENFAQKQRKLLNGLRWDDARVTMTVEEVTDYFAALSFLLDRDLSRRAEEEYLQGLRRQEESLQEEVEAQKENFSGPGLRALQEEVAQRRRAREEQEELLAPGSAAWEEKRKLKASLLREALPQLHILPQGRALLEGEPLFRGEAFDLYYVDEEADLRGKLAPELCYVGRPSPQAYGEALAAATRQGEALVAALEEDALPEAGDGPALEAAGFRFLGQGLEQTAYLHRESGLVYKVRYASLRPQDQASSPETLQQAHEHAQEQYALINGEELAARGAEYVPTHFLSLRDGEGRPLSMVVQPYLDPAEYVPAEAHYLQGAVAGVRDAHTGNVRQSLVTGKYVLFDCTY